MSLKGDEADQAQENIERFNEAAVQKARAAASAVETHPDFDGEHCIECAIEIPVGRLRLGRIRCCDCQTVKEQRAKLAGGR